jgi:two-component system cell cycle sensor histidine kinase/response regulator CckA
LIAIREEGRGLGIPLRVLFVEDNPDDVALVERELRRCGYDLSTPPERVETAADLTEALGRTWDVIVSDFSMPLFTGPEALAVCRERGVSTPFIIVSGTVGEEQAVSALKAGASDFVSKQNLARLGPAVARELREAESREARRKVEAQLLRAQKMDAIGQLAGGVAHDLNNILGVILGHGELILRSTQDEQHRRRVNSICDAADRAATLVRHLLAVSRRQIVQPTVLSLNHIVTETMKMLERLIGEHIEVVYGLAPDLWTIKADVSQVEQVFMNLVINARDAMPQGGTLWVETRNVSIDREGGPVPCGDHVMLQVSDTGSGMDETVLSHIFEPFFTTKEPGKGTGLGLATVYGIVNQSEGHIEVESQPGKGTTFRIHLPRAERPQRAAALPAAAADAHGGTETVLLLEDEVNLRLLIREVLEEAGYRILSAETPEEALQIGASYTGPIRLFLTDVVLPRLNGFEIASRMTAARPDLKVLFMSGYRDPAGRLPSAPSAPLLAKPFKGDALLAAVRSALDARA